MARLEGAYEQINERLAGIERRFDTIERRFDGIERRMDGIDRRIDGLARQLNTQFYWLLSLILGSILIPILRDLAR